MIKIIRTNSDNEDFKNLVKQLDAYLEVTDGDEHSFCNQYNKLDKIKHVIVAYDNDVPLGCGAIKEFESKVMEVKRMYTSPENRGKGIASKIIAALEKWTTELLYEKCILEVGIRQAEAVVFYKKNRYIIIPNYGQYIGVENSLCFEKIVT